MRTSRRSLLRSAGLAAAVASQGLRGDDSAASGSHFQPWKQGGLEIHHISTGRGNATLAILPDGTTVMVDTGAIYGSSAYLIDPKPDDSRRPGEWVGRYVRRHLSAAGLDAVDCFLTTHLHGDHIGYLSPTCPAAPGRDYRLTGVSDVAALVDCRRFIDRGWPDYNYPSALNEDFQLNYRSFLVSAASRGVKVERFRPGASDQFGLARNPARYPEFEIRNLAVNGEVWTGAGNAAIERYPELSKLKPEDYPVENGCSAALRLTYGKFRYYTGGDLMADTRYGRDPWRDIESPVAQVCGHVSVAVANHHGHYNANGPAFIRSVRPRAFIIAAWDSLHPSASTLAAMFSKDLYLEPRDGFATAIKPENKIANRRIADLKSTGGHTIVRVAPGGSSFGILILDNADESDRVTAVFGPYDSA